MSSLTDSEMIDNLLGRTGGSSKFEDQQLLYLNDQNQGSYTNPIKFNTLTWIDDWMAYPKAYATIPLRAVGFGSTDDFATATLITVDENKVATPDYDKVQVTTKNGLYSLVNSLNIKINGNTVQNSSDLHLMNNIKAHTKWSKDYAESSGVLHHFAKDTDIVNDADNKGFLERCELTNYAVKITQAGPDGVCTLTVDFNVEIHLSIISDFFDTLGMPLKNANIDLVIGLNGLDKGSGAGQDWDCLAVNAEVKEALGGGNIKLQIGNQWEKVCKLFCPRISFSASDALELDELLRDPKGFQKTVVWDDCQVVKNTQSKISENLNMVLSPSIRRPLQVWSYFLPISNDESSMKRQEVPYPFVTHLGIKSHHAPSASSSGVAITNANLRVDSKKLYEENIDSQAQFYEMLRDQTLSGSDDKQTGSLISYKDFHEQYQFYCFDLTRTNYKITDKPVALEFLAKKLNAAKETDLFHVIVLETISIFNFVNGNVKVTNVGAQ